MFLHNNFTNLKKNYNLLICLLIIVIASICFQICSSNFALRCAAANKYAGSDLDLMTLKYKISSVFLLLCPIQIFIIYEIIHDLKIVLFKHNFYLNLSSVYF